MKRRTTLLALGCVAAFSLSGCNHEDRRTDAGDARSEADAGRDAAQSAALWQSSGAQPAVDASAPMDQVPVAQQGGAANATLAMSGTPSSHLVDGAGSAVYVLAGNTDGGKCDAACQEAWPPVLAHEARPTAGAGVEGGRIGTLEREGRTHVTYGGQPLYRYSGDAGAGRTAGAGVQDQWGTWSLVGLDGQPLPDPE